MRSKLKDIERGDNCGSQQRMLLMAIVLNLPRWNKSGPSGRLPRGGTVGSGLESPALLSRFTESLKKACCQINRGVSLSSSGKVCGVVILFAGFSPRSETEPGGLAAVHMCMVMSTHAWGKVSADPLQTTFPFCSCPARQLTVPLESRALEPQ